MRWKWILMLGVMSTLAVVPAWAQQQTSGSPNYGEQKRVEFEIRRWRPDLDAELILDGTQVDPVIDLGVEDKQGFDIHFGVRFAGRFKARGNRVEFDYTGTGAINRDLTIGGIDIAQGTPVDTELKVIQVKAGVEVDLIQGQYAVVSVIAEYARFDVSPQFVTPGDLFEPDRLRMEMPVFGAKGRVYLTPALAVTLEGTGFQRESVGVMTDWEVVGTYNMVPAIAISYGYRNSYNRFNELQEFGDRAIFRFKGQFVGVTIRF